MISNNLLLTGEIVVTGRLVDASNASLYAEISDGTRAQKVIYKPIVGERPLWDFPDGTLADREVAAYKVSEVLGLHLVPPTILRDGPYGPGMVQMWIESDEDFDVTQCATSTDVQLRQMVIFDAIINNTDRKFGHILVNNGKILGCDHGVSFHQMNKLRTVLWQFSGTPLESEDLDLLTRALGMDFDLLAEHLTHEEVEATRARISALLQSGIYPEPSDEWPAVPWPPF